MSSDDEGKDTCEFGHTFELLVDDDPDILDDIRSGEISSLKDVEEEKGSKFLKPLMGDNWKKMKISASSQGNAFVVVMSAADKFDEDLEYSVDRTEEKIFVSPQSQVHDEFMQRQQQAEQRIKGTMQNLSELRKQKHMLEHDIRKLRSRVENFGDHDETTLKGDFVELVDGAGAQQGGDEASLKFYRDQNIYPSIVADFMEMDGVEDLEEDGKLDHLPENIKAILKKKYVMYEKWKDMYGSEVRRKLEDLQAQQKSVERSIEETKDWLQPYVKDIIRIHDKEKSDLADEFNTYYTFEGYSSMERTLEFICHKPLKKTEAGEIVSEGQAESFDDDEITHYRIIYIHGVQINLGDPSQPTSPAGGPATGVVMWHPAVVCKHVFENIFKEKIEWNEKQYESLLEDYVGDLTTEESEKIKEARKDKFGTVRSLREKMAEEMDEDVPLGVSSLIRRIEDGMDRPEKMKQRYDEEYYDTFMELLEIEQEEEEEQTPISDFKKEMKIFAGQVDDYYLNSQQKKTALGDLETEFKFDYYINYKKSKGYYTML